MRHKITAITFFKKIFLFGLLLFLPASFQSCEDGLHGALDKIPDDRLELTDITKDYEMLRGLLSQAYTMMQQTHYQLWFHYIFEGLTDNAADAIRGYPTHSGWHAGNLSLSENPIDVGIMDDRYRFTTGWWGWYWAGVRYTNLAIKYISEADEEVVPIEDKNRWIDEARLLRAWYHFRLISFWGPLPFLDTYYDVNYDGWKDITRPSYDEIATKIAAECQAVIDNGNLSVREESSDLRKRLTGGFAYALKSRVLLYNASPLNNPENDLNKWQRAADAAKQLIDLNVFTLVPMSEYDNLFTSKWDNEPSEIIWRSPYDDLSMLDYIAGIDLTGQMLTQVPSAEVAQFGAYKAAACPTQELVDCFEMKNGALPILGYTSEDHTQVSINPDAVLAGYGEGPGEDPYSNRDARFYECVWYNGYDFGILNNRKQAWAWTCVDKSGNPYPGSGLNLETWDKTHTGYYAAKQQNINFFAYQNVNQAITYSSRHMVFFRMAEIYLNYAEALCELDQLADAQNILNIVRERAGQPHIQNVPGYQADKDWLRNRIRNERRVELCYEIFQRFCDSRRWIVLNEGKYATGMRVIANEIVEEPDPQNEDPNALRIVPKGPFVYERFLLPGTEGTRLSYTDKYLVLPIPLEEALRLPNLEQPIAWR